MRTRTLFGIASQIEKVLEKYLGIPRYRRSEIDRKDEVGGAVGMAWTEFGGELLTFEVTKVHGKGNFMLTGQLGEIMQESAQAAFSYVRGKMYELNIAKDLHKNFDIHIHVPEGATPKEGPSAGITIATSIISLLTGIPVSIGVGPNKTLAKLTSHIAKKQTSYQGVCSYWDLPNFRNLLYSIPVDEVWGIGRKW